MLKFTDISRIVPILVERGLLTEEERNNILEGADSYVVLSRSKLIFTVLQKPMPVVNRVVDIIIDFQPDILGKETLFSKFTNRKQIN